MRKGVYLNDVPLDVFLKYFTSEDLQDRILERKMVEDTRDYYEYDVTVDATTYTYYSHLNLDSDADELALEAYKDLLEIIPGLEPSDIDPSTDISLVSTISAAQMYLSPVRIGAVYPHRYRFVYESDGQVLGFIAVDGSIDTISDITSITISDTRDGSDALGYLVNLTLNTSESRYYVYDASTSALVGYIYENDESTVQKVDSLGRPLYIDESGNETHEPLRRSRFLRHSQSLRSAFAPGQYVSRPEEVSFSRFLPGVVGLFKQGSDKKLIYHEKFLRTKSYERIALSGEEYTETSIPASLKAEMPTVGDTYAPDAESEYKLRELLDFSTVRKVTCSFDDESLMRFRLPSGVPSPVNGDPIVVRVERNTVNYENVSYSTNISESSETIEVGSDDLELFRDETVGKTFLRIPVKRELSAINSRYIEPTESYVARLFVFNDTTKTWDTLGIEQVYSVTNASDVTFGGSGAFVTGLFTTLLLPAGTKVYITSTNQLRRVNSTSTALEAATATNNYVYVPKSKAYKNSQPNSLYQYTTSWARIGEARTSKPSSSEIYDEYVRIGTENFSVSSYVKTTRPVERIGLVNPTIRGKTYTIKTDSTNPVYSLGYIEYEVSVSSSRTGVEYFGQASSVSGRTFVLSKYSPAYSDTGVNGEDFDLTGYTESLGTYSRTYYLRDFSDRSFAVEVTETISKSGDNADDASTPLWTEFMDEEHTYTDTGSLTGFDLATGRACYRSGTSVSGPSVVERFETRFSDFGHSLLDGSFKLSTRGDLIPDNTIYDLRKRVTGEMAVDFVNRPGSGLFTVSNVGKDANAPMKMRVYAEALLAMATATSLREGSPQGISSRTLTQVSDLPARISLQRAEGADASGIKPRSYDDSQFSAERLAAASDVSSLNAYQRLREYSEFPTNESRFRSSFESRKRSTIMASSTSSESALDDVVGYDKTTRVSPVSKSEFRRQVRDTIHGFFFNSELYSQDDFYLRNYRKYYKPKLDSVSESYPEASGRAAYKLSLSRAAQASDPSGLISRILSRFDESGNEREWRVL